MALRDAFVNIAKNAAAGAAQKMVSGVASSLRSGLGGSSSSSASSPLQTNFAPKETLLLYPSDVGTNMHQASYILFARHSVSGGKVKPAKHAPKVTFAQALATFPGDVDQGAVRRKQAKMQDEADGAAAQSQATGGAGPNGTSRSLLLQRRNIQKTGTAIGLYMPPAVNVQYNMDYSDGEIGVMGEALYGLFKSYQNGTLGMDAINNAAGTLGTGLEKMGVGMIDKVIPGAKDLYAIEQGAIITPRTEMMFRGTNRRSFSFSFTFIPKSAEETQIVHKIIKEFKIGMSPSFKTSGSTREMTIPDVFSIQYMHINGPNNYINKIGKCYLKTMDVSYGGDKFVTYNADKEGAPPQKTTISLSFQELEIMDRANVEAGY
jgi:peptidoglycan hydrolase-like protein with peptidoglycan-binding domain